MSLLEIMVFKVAAFCVNWIGFLLAATVALLLLTGHAAVECVTMPPNLRPPPDINIQGPDVLFGQPLPVMRSTPEPEPATEEPTIMAQSTSTPMTSRRVEIANFAGTVDSVGNSANTTVNGSMALINGTDNSTDNNGTTTTTTPIVTVEVKQGRYLPTAVDECGRSVLMSLGGQPFTVEEASQLLSDDTNGGITRVAQGPIEFPWIAVLTSLTTSPLKFYCHGVVVNEITVITTKSCFKFVTAQNKTFLVRVGLSNGAQDRSETDDSRYIASFIVNANQTIDDPSGNITLINLPAPISLTDSFTFGRICLERSVELCRKSCRRRFLGLAMGGAALDFTRLKAPSPTMRTLIIMPNQSYTPAIYIGMQRLNDGASVGVMRNGQMTLCGFFDATQNFYPFCNLYSWLVTLLS